MSNLEKFKKLVTDNGSKTIDKIRWRIADREALREEALKEIERLDREDRNK